MVLIPVPFTDLKAVKKRPGIIISSDKFNKKGEDIIISAITSNTKKQKGIKLGKENLENGKLPKPSLILPNKLYTLKKAIILKKFGKINSKTFNELKEKIIEIIE